MKQKIISIPPTYFGCCIIINIFLYFFIPKMNLIIFPMNLFGIFLMLFGFFLISSPYYLFKKYNTPEKYEKSTCVVETGLYKYSRNPMYLGGLFFLTGLSVLLGNIISFISPILFFIIMNWMFIPYEEEKMEKEVGQKYSDYKRKVRCWL